MIELLVVISIIALLLAILLPTLQRVRKQAQAVGCQANLRQWGILWATYATDNDGRLPARGGSRPQDSNSPVPASLIGLVWAWADGEPASETKDRYARVKDILYCPSATKLADPIPAGKGWVGGTFFAWGGADDSRPWGYVRGSYGSNVWTPAFAPDSDVDFKRLHWTDTAAKNAAAVPILLDSCVSWTGGGIGQEMRPPPPFDAIPTAGYLNVPGPWGSCINRHDGCVKGLFLDWSVRRVGLKELWMLKWHREYDTRGPWTKAGGVRPEDWPPWMRQFKDY